MVEEGSFASARSAATGWGHNTEYPFLPTKSPFETYSMQHIKNAQSNFDGINSVIYYPTEWLA